MITFDAAHRAVHYPPDRRVRLWVRPSALGVLIALALIPLVFAWAQAAFYGLPTIPPVPVVNDAAPASPHGFPVWLRYGHFLNFLFITFLIRSGLSILADHPRLYFNNDCTPGSEWVRFTPITVPTERIWTAKDDARYVSPLVALPGYRHTVGVARSWHFLNVYGFVITGVCFVTMLFVTEQWRRLMPTSTTVLVQAWNTFVHYANFHFPPEPNGFYGYNALQQLTYFFMVFVMGPLSIGTGVAMSPALVSHLPWYPRVFGGRQAARSLHFLAMLGYVGFIIAHVTLVVLTGFTRNMNHIVMGTDDLSPRGIVLGFAGFGVVGVGWIVAHYVSWHAPRRLQHLQRAITLPLTLRTLDTLLPAQRYRADQISPHFWPNGKLPTREEWKRLHADSFRDYRLPVGGLVRHPVSLSLAELRALGTNEFITMHHCIQGWTGIARWTGVPMSKIVALVQPMPAAKAVAFFSFGDGLYGGTYYDTQRIENLQKRECLLAFAMNGAPLPAVYGAPLRLRVENQLGYKMVKWIERIEFVASEREIGAGEGGKNEDDEYFDLLPNI